MSGAPFRVAPLNAIHDKATFNSDSEPLNRYLREQVSQDIRRRVAACFVALTDEQRIAGYYTLASASLLLTDLPANMGKKLPRYPTVPTVRMGRLAVDQTFKGQGLGGALLADALDRAARIRDCRLCADSRCQRQYCCIVLSASRFHTTTRFAIDPVFAAGNGSALLNACLLLGGG